MNKNKKIALTVAIILLVIIVIIVAKISLYKKTLNDHYAEAQAIENQVSSADLTNYIVPFSTYYQPSKVDLEGVQGNMKVFQEYTKKLKNILKNNPGFSSEQVKTISDSIALSTFDYTSLDEVYLISTLAQDSITLGNDASSLGSAPEDDISTVQTDLSNLKKFYASSPYKDCNINKIEHEHTLDFVDPTEQTGQQVTTLATKEVTFSNVCNAFSM